MDVTSHENAIILAVSWEWNFICQFEKESRFWGYLRIICWEVCWHLRQFGNKESERIPCRVCSFYKLPDVLLWLNKTHDIYGTEWCNRKCVHSFFFWGGSRFLQGLSQWPRVLRHELSSLARTMKSWVRIPIKAWMFGVCMRLFCVCVVLCLGSGLATSWSPVQGVLLSVKIDYGTQ
jgi:hypothetical protein